jgi:uncharacterized protein YjiS (DUF1127 family)
MAHYETTRSQFGGQSLAGRLSTTVASVMSELVAWNNARMTRNALARLSDRELDDIGLSRGAIDEVAKRLAR